MTTSQFLKAVGSGNLEKVQCLSKEYLNEVNTKGQSALHVAIIENQSEIMDFLLHQENIDVNLQDKKFGYSPLMQCIISKPSNFMHVFEKLLSIKTIRLDLADKSGENILHLCLEFGLNECFNLVMKKSQPPVTTKNQKGLAPIHLACAQGNTDALLTLLQRPEVDINVTDSDGNSPLHWAILGLSESTYVIVQILINKKALIQKNKDQNTALHLEAMYCETRDAWPTDVATFLLEYDSKLSGIRNKLTYEIDQNTAEELIMLDNISEEKVLIGTESQVMRNRNNKDNQEKERHEKEERVKNAKAGIAARYKKKKKGGNKDDEENFEPQTNTWITIIALFIGLTLFFFVVYWMLILLSNK